MRDSNRFLKEVFESYVPPSELDHLGTSAMSAIGRRLRASNLSDPYHYEQVLAKTAERLEERFRRSGGAVGIRNFRNYFLTSAKHEASRYVRQESGRRTVGLEALDSLRELQRSLEAEIRLPFESLIEGELIVEITVRALSTLTEREQSLVRGSLRSQTAEPERARELGLSLGGLRSAVFRAFRRLKEAVAAEIEREIVTLSERPATAPTPRRGGAD